MADYSACRGVGPSHVRNLTQVHAANSFHALNRRDRLTSFRRVAYLSASWLARNALLLLHRADDDDPVLRCPGLLAWDTSHHRAAHLIFRPHQRGLSTLFLPR